MNLESKRVLAGGLAAGLIGVAAPHSQAYIVYTPDSTAVNSGHVQDLIDFEQTSSAPASINYDATSGLFLEKQRDFSFEDFVVPAGSSTLVAALPYGESIGPTSNFANAGGSIGELNNGDGSSGQFVQSNPLATQYLGVSFDSADAAGTLDYGWIGFEVTNDSSLADLSGIVTGYAYDNSGSAITAGAVPEPASLALLAMGAVGLGAYRRRSPIRH